MVVNVFGKDIFLKKYGCQLGRREPRNVPPSVNIFVKVTDSCNARCAFCSNGGCHKDRREFNHNKLWSIVDELQRKEILINRINITGGEPSTAMEKVEQILNKAAAQTYNGIHVHLNTNGLLLSSQSLMRHPRWNSISMSLHHYDAYKLSKIYGVPIPATSFAFEGINLDKVNASCNLIRGYIDIASEVEKMMKYAISLGLPRLGFVALMKVNDYCKEHFVDFSEINFTSIPHLYFTESRNRGADCKCSNYLYNHDGRILEVYMRNYANPNYCESSLMYDGQFLRQGFHDDNIIY